MKNFPSLAKEIDFQEVKEAQRVPKKLDPRKHAPRHIIITLAKIKDKERVHQLLHSCLPALAARLCPSYWSG